MSLLLAGCGGAPDDSPRVETRIAEAPSVPAVAHPALPATQSRGAHRTVNTIDKDPDGDGIANRRIIVTEVYDDRGALVERIREQDFEADGIIDARSVTHFDGTSPFEP